MNSRGNNWRSKRKRKYANKVGWIKENIEGRKGKRDGGRNRRKHGKEENKEGRMRENVK